MKKQFFALLFAGAWISVGALTTDAQVRILPYGDSVTTFGANPESSYRYWLYQKLVDAGFSFDFVGTASGVENGTPANSWPDEDYAGHEGWTTSDAVFSSNLNAALGTQPDVVLLDFGSNDILQGFDLKTTTAANLAAIIEAFAAQKSDIVILVSVPTGFVPSPDESSAERKREKSQQSKLEGVVSRVIKTERKAGINVIKVNQFGGFNPKKDTDDGSHPNVQGEQKIANKYFTALKKVL